MPGVSAKPSAVAPSAHAIALERDLLASAAKEAGALALSMQKAGVNRIKKKDGSPVSDADLAVNALLEKTLRSQRPDYGWLSEESADSIARQHTTRTFIVDPIDGTADFLSGVPRWCIALALLNGTELIASAIYNPVTDDLFAAGLNMGATCNDAPIRISQIQSLENCLMLSNPHFERPEWPIAWPKMRVQPGGSCGQRMADIAAGRADAYVSMSKKWEWDAAPGALLVTEAGGIVTDAEGQPFAYNLVIPQQPSIIASAPSLHSAIVERTKDLAAKARNQNLRS